MLKKHGDCDIHGGHGSHWSCRPPRFWRHIFSCLLLLVILVLLAIFIIWLVLRPTRPRFYLQDATIIQLNISSPGYGDAATLDSVLQVTISSRNPNDRIGVYYDRLVAYGKYKGQQITGATVLPGGYQGHNDVIVWSPYLFGYNIPIPPYLAESLAQDKHAGYLLLSIRIDGRLRWKVGTWTSGGYHIHVNCPAYLAVDYGKSHGGNGNYGSYYLRFQQMSACNVDI